MKVAQLTQDLTLTRCDNDKLSSQIEDYTTQIIHLQQIIDENQSNLGRKDSQLESVMLER